MLHSRGFVHVKTGKLRILTILGMILLLTLPTSFSPAAADPSQRGGSYTLSYTITDPKWIDRRDELTAVAERDGNLDALGIKSAPEAAAKGPLTAEESLRVARENNAEYGIDSRKYAGPVSTADPSYDYISLEECWRNGEQAIKPEGWIKNHFAYCKMFLHVLVHRECFIICRTSTFNALSTLIGDGKKGERRTEFNLIFAPIRATGIYTTANLGVRMSCDAGSGSCDSDPGNGRTDSVGGWIRNNRATFKFSSPGLPPGPGNGEQVVFASAQAHYRVDAPRIRDWNYSSPDTGLRFDSAWYLTYKEGSVFNRVTPWLAFSVQDEPVKYSAWNIYNATQFPASTQPFVENKQIDGGAPDKLIHRLFHDKNRRKANRAEATGFCGQRWAGYPELGQDCDEFPFACTYEGAARYKYSYRGGPQYERMYAVKPIPSADNQESGRRLGAWFGDDRIIDDDGFYVRIMGVNGGAPEPPTGPPVPPNPAIDCGDGLE